MFIYTKNNNMTTHKFLNIFNSNVILNVTVFCSDTLNLKKIYFNNSSRSPYSIHWLQQHCNILRVTIFIYYISVSCNLVIELPEGGLNDCERSKCDT